ncbi:MAG: PAS domain-containing protein [Deltaproteobacteria bacterium]|nr:PAS domain-containing protein [Deltaproteobacteria bacterium]
MGILALIVRSIQPKELPSGPEYRKLVEWLMLLRVVVTTLLLVATIFFQLSGRATVATGVLFPLYILIATIFILSLLYALSLPRITNLWGFSFFQVIADLVYYTALVYFTGGASSAFTFIYVFPIVTSGILHFRRGAFLTAAVASILFGLLINFQFHGLIPESDWPWVVAWDKSSPGHVLWVMVVHFTVFFLIALMASTLAEQLQVTRTALSLRERDFEKLSDLHLNIVRSIPSGIITTDENDNITYVNRSGAALLAAPLHGLVHRPLSEIFTVTREDGLASTDSRKPYFTVKEINGERRDIHLTVSDLMDVDGVRSGRLVVFQDVTELRKMEERVRLSERQAALVRVAAGMAHEIRNPLAALRGATEMLGQFTGEVEDQAKLFDIVLREADRINSLLEDFAAAVSVRRTRGVRVMLDQLVEDTIELFFQDAEVKQKVVVEPLLSRGLEVEGDPRRLRHAVWHLLKNAAEASPENGVIRVTLEADEEKGQARLNIQDAGFGIAPEMKERLFEPFATTKPGGVGLGLSVALGVAQSHGGTVEVWSNASSGTTFSIKLPLAAEEVTDNRRDKGNAGS